MVRADASSSGFRAGDRGQHFDDIPGMRMRPMSRTLQSDADVEAVAAYVASLPPRAARRRRSRAATPPRGQTLYAPCTACHGVDGAATRRSAAPPLDHQSDWYLLTQLQHFKAGRPRHQARRHAAAR